MQNIDNVFLVVFLIVFYILLSISLYFLFPKAGVDGVKGLIPGVNFIEWSKLIGRPKWYPLLLLVPILNIFIFCGMAVDLVRSFKKYKFKHTAGAVLAAPLAFYQLSKKKDVAYDGPNYIKEKEFLKNYNKEMHEARKKGDKRKIERLDKNNPYKKSFFREWTESIFFAVFAAAFIRMFFIEAFVIPTPSMEGSLMVGDFLFVSKPSYGIRTPMTVAMLPLLHNRIPFSDSESYLKKPSLDYHRLPGLESIERNKPIVFNWPVGDTVYVTSARPYAIGQVRRDPSMMNRDPELSKKVRKKNFVVRPIDKKDHYIKRCVAMPGDSLEIKDGQIYINGEKGKNPEKMQFLYKVNGDFRAISKKKLKDWNIAQTKASVLGNMSNPSYLYLTDDQFEKLQAYKDKFTLTNYEHEASPSTLFPFDSKLYPNQSINNYGPIWIPQQGATVDISMDNISLYRRIIDVYENNDFEIKNNKIFINGAEANTYTFKQDYYWAMGDNRDNSEDSRAWGYVPHDHIVGKPLFIWFSTKNANWRDGIRFNRMFKSADVD